MSYCQNCGAEVQAYPSNKNHQVQVVTSVQPLTRRIAVILYIIAYVGLIGLSIGVAESATQYYSTPDPSTSYITCKSGSKVAYRLLGIRNPVTDVGHDDLLIDAACRDLGGNTYTNVVKTGPKATAWQYASVVFLAGVFIIELMKGTLVYLIKGYFPGLGTLSHR